MPQFPNQNHVNAASHTVTEASNHPSRGHDLGLSVTHVGNFTTSASRAPGQLGGSPLCLSVALVLSMAAQNGPLSGMSRGQCRSGPWTVQLEGSQLLGRLAV